MSTSVIRPPIRCSVLGNFGSCSDTFCWGIKKEARARNKREFRFRTRTFDRPFENGETKGDQPFEILPSLCGKCFRHTGQNFLISNFSDIVRLFLVVV